MITETPTPLPTPTPVPTDPRPGVICTNYIRNGGFEEQPRGTGWLEDSDFDEPIIRTEYPFSGGWGAWFGGYDNGSDILATDYTIPHRPPDRGRPGDLVGATLSFVWQVYGDEVSTGVYDYWAAGLYDEESDELAVLAFLSNESRRDRWRGWKSNVTQQMVRSAKFRNSRFAMYSENDATHSTSWLIDDVVLEVCYRGPGRSAGDVDLSNPGELPPTHLDPQDTTF